MIKSNWAKNSFFKNRIIYPKNINDLKKLIKKTGNLSICGNLRSYGDTCINEKKLISLNKFPKVLSINKDKKVITVSSNMLLIDILNKIMPSGYMIDITPGSKYVTIGGMIANNIIGKNLYKNQFKFIIQEIEILKGDNKIITCTPYKNKKIFNLTVGGFGLTGVILKAKIKISKINNSYIDQEIYKFSTLNQFLRKIKKKSLFSVSWIDSHSLEKNKFRGFVQTGNYNDDKNLENSIIINDKKLNFFSKILLSFYIKFSFVSKFINYLFYITRPRYKKVNFNDFFYPQDKFLDWNECYRNGLFQTQFLVEEKKFKKIIEKISIFFTANKIKSTFIIIKKINEKGNYLGYKGKGYSLSFDFEINDNYFLITNFFNKIFKDFNLNLYLSKDSIVNKNLIVNNRNFKTFKKDLKLIDKNKKFVNNFSNRFNLK
tara:strand:+ start:358 stop:1650 length:1293 start_codon:yes stop_codon:yes gene_type:complete